MGASAFAFSGAATGMLLHPASGSAQATSALGGLAGAAPALAQFTRVSSLNVATINPNLLRFHNPGFRPPILTNQGVDRTTLSLPTMISPSATPDDQMLFEDPQDATRKFFLTRYQIATTATGSTVGKWVTFAPDGASFLLTVHLADTTAPSQVQGNGRLSPDTRYLISATLQGRIATWDLSAAPPGPDGTLTLTLPIADFAGRDLLYAAMTDPTAQAQLIVRRSLPLGLPVTATSQYEVQNVAIDGPTSFTFSKDLDAQVFAGLQGAAAAPLAPWNVLNLDWNGRSHTYFQSASQRDQVYFLPDAFKVGRQTQSPHLPNLAVTTQGDTAASLVMTLSYFAVPEWDPKRLADAAPRLQQALGLPQPPSLALFEASSAILMLSLPGDDPAAGVTLQQQPNVLIDLAAGVQGSVTLGLAAFRQIYDALFDTRSTVLSGEVRVSVGNNTTALPFVARISDLAGDIFDSQVSIDSKHNTMSVTLTNAIESAIHVAALTGVIARNGTALASNVTAITPKPPTDLPPPGAAPGGVLTVTLAPSLAGGLGGLLGGGGLGGLFGGGGSGPNLGKLGGGLASLVLDSSCAPLFDFSQVTVTPDPTATWNAIMANGVPSPVNRVVTLKLIAATLAQPGGTAPPGPDAVLAVQVVFDGGQTASFDASQTADTGGFLTQVVTLTVPIAAFVLGSGPTDTYSYRIDSVTPDGVRQGTPVADNRDVIYVVPG
jgi:hypothetical protein